VAARAETGQKWGLHSGAKQCLFDNPAKFWQSFVILQNFLVGKQMWLELSFSAAREAEEKLLFYKKLLLSVWK